MYYVRLQHPRQTEGGLPQWTSLDRSGQVRIVDRFAIGQCGMAEEFTEKLIEKMREYVFLYNTGHAEYKKLLKKA
jgi:hypothetical protein